MPKIYAISIIKHGVSKTKRIHTMEVIKQKISTIVELLEKLMTDFSMVQKHNMQTYIKIDRDKEIDICELIEFCLKIEHATAEKTLEQFAKDVCSKKTKH
jgi:hypothetical protein